MAQSIALNVATKPNSASPCPLKASFLPASAGSPVRFVREDHNAMQDFRECPYVDLGNGEPQRYRKHRQNRESAGGCLEDTANQKAPRAAGEMLDHQQRQASGRNTDPK